MKKVFKCDFCNYESEQKNITEQHEKNCCYNPKLKACQSCKYLKILLTKKMALGCCHFMKVGIRVVDCDLWEEKK